MFLASGETHCGDFDNDVIRVLQPRPLDVFHAHLVRADVVECLHCRCHGSCRVIQSDSKTEVRRIRRRFSGRGMETGDVYCYITTDDARGQTCPFQIGFRIPCSSIPAIERLDELKSRRSWQIYPVKQSGTCDRGRFPLRSRRGSSWRRQAENVALFKARWRLPHVVRVNRDGGDGVQIGATLVQNWRRLVVKSSEFHKVPNLLVAIREP